jgi:hypothetical protein
MLISRTLIKKKGSSNNIDNPFLSPTDFYKTYLKKIASRSSGVTVPL